MKNFLIIVISFFLCINTNSQQKKIDKFPNHQYTGKLKNDDFFNKSEFIFEGELLSTKSFLQSDSTTVYSASLVKIISVIKGKINTDTIELVRDCGSIFGQDLVTLHSYNNEFSLDLPNKGFYFCNTSNESLLAKGYQSLKLLTNEKEAALYYFQRPRTEYSFILFGLNDLYFKTLDDFYKYASKFNGVKVPDINKKQFFLKSAQINNEQKLKLDSFMLWQNKLKGYANAHKKSLGKTKAAAAITDLNITINNQTISGSTTQYFEFDVMASSSANVYYSNAISRIDFNTSIFGYNLATNNKITLTRGTGFSSSTYDVKAYDVNSGRVNISLNEISGLTSWNRTLITSTSVVLFHVKIEILSTALNNTADIIFSETDYTPMFSLYSLSSGGDYMSLLSYDNTYYTNPVSYSVELTPEINSFSPTNISAGMGAILYIYGKNFGNTTGDVWFTDVNDDKNTRLIQGSQGYVQTWSNTSIAIKVPSYAVDRFTNLAYCAGSGFFDVVTASGKHATSKSRLIVDVAFRNMGIPSQNNDKKIYLVKKNGINGVQFTLHTSLQNNTSAITCIKKALCEWSGKLGIEICLETDANGNLVYTNTYNVVGSGKNVIYFSTTRNGGMQAQGIANSNNSCSYYSNWYYYINERFDIEMAQQAAKATDGSINRWNYSLSGSVIAGDGSFYQAFLHEVGHILGLSHVRDPNALMFTTIDLSKSNTIINLSSTIGAPLQTIANHILDCQRIALGCNGISTINKVKPNIIYYKINNGDAETRNVFRSVTLNNKCSVCPTEYMASEAPYMAGATWQPYDEAPSFTLSSGAGVKGVSFKVRNAAGESISMSDQITFRPLIKSALVEVCDSTNTAQQYEIAEEFTEIQQSDAISFSAYPVPCFKQLNISIPNNNDSYRLQIFNSAGVMIYTSNLTEANNQIDLTTIPTGTYYVKLSNKNNSYAKTIIKH